MYSPLKKTKVILVISSHQSKPGYRMCYIWVAKLNIIYIMPKYLRKNMRFFIKNERTTHFFHQNNTSIGNKKRKISVNLSLTCNFIRCIYMQEEK